MPTQHRVEEVGHGRGRFFVEDLLVQGQRHDLYLARDEHLDAKVVCIKAIRYGSAPERAEIEWRRAALREELGHLTLAHPMVPEPLDYLTVVNPHFAASSPWRDSEPLLVMEMQPGEVLSTRMARMEAGIELRHALVMLRELALMLSALHRQGAVFCDLHPAHVIIGLDDVMHVVGWGNVRRLGSAVRTDAWSLSGYMAPELHRGGAPTPGVDVYGLGALLATLLTGLAPQAGARPLAAEAQGRLARHDPGVQAVLAAALWPDPARRWPALAPLLAAMEALAAGAQPEAPHLAWQDLFGSGAALGAVATVAVMPSGAAASEQADVAVERAEATAVAEVTAAAQADGALARAPGRGWILAAVITCSVAALAVLGLILALVLRR